MKRGHWRRDYFTAEGLGKVSGIALGPEEWVGVQWVGMREEHSNDR